jgi:radical SAM protein with 4Fe4S-binding SPASM domain
VVLASFHTWAGQVEEMGVNKKKIERYPCPVPWYNPVINFDGKVSACCVNIDENELIMGDVKKASLAQIWQSEQFQRLRRAQLAQDFALFPTCRECGFWKILPNLTAFLKKLEQRNEKA